MKLLINLANIREWRPIATQIPADRINPYIQEAQQFDLKQLLGDALYADFLAKYDVSGDPQYANYQALLKGGTYTYGAVTLENPGLIPFLVYMTLARFYNNNQVNATRYGLVSKLAEESEAVDWRGIAAAVAELRANARAFADDLTKFLGTMQTSYPLFNRRTDGGPMEGGGVKFFDPDDTNDLTGNGRTTISL